MRRLLQVLVVLLAVVVVSIVGAGFWARTELRGSLPPLDGSLRLPGLTAQVEITRDALGVPTIRAATREDVARATGFVHAQDRFFQMDLARRRASGELAALVGPRATRLDREIRVHRFREEAHRAVTMLTQADRAFYDAYAAGVNSGLRSLRVEPFEYLMLRQEPQAWQTEDTLLVVLSMFITLQDTEGEYESTLATMHDVLPEPVLEFLAPRGTEWDAPVVGTAFSVPPIPGPEIYNLRERRKGRPTIPRRARPTELTSNIEPCRLPTADCLLTSSSLAGLSAGVRDAVGSNNWAVAGRLSANGVGLVANDMHLSIRVPNTWYRAVLEWPDPDRPSTTLRLMGLTLPGVPALVTGSNSYIAWGFTNTYADWSDIVLVETDPNNPRRYRTPDGWRDFDRFDEVIHVAGEADEHVPVIWTIWGPLLAPDHRGRLRAYRWVAHSAERLAASVVPLEHATTIEEAFDAANGLGTPGQNFVVADRSGRIGWSVYGSIPRRIGLDGQLPVSWGDGARGWNGWLDDAEYPRILDPPGGRIWTANARVVDGEMLAKLGDGSYEVGSRAHQISERLRGKERFTPRDLLSIQLDVRADFLARWRDLILATLTPSNVAGKPLRATFRDIVDREWKGEASADSTAYRLTRTFRDVVSERVIGFVLAECYETDPTFTYTTVRRREGPIWKLVTKQPMHLLDPAYASWEQLLTDSVDGVIAETMGGKDGDLHQHVWSEYDVTTYRHPLSGAVPLFGRWLDMPPHALPGDLYTPRVQWGAIGASERMVVSPGRESEGILHMPTGQSGHPLSPFYSNSHDAWVNGEATPFLPGRPEHVLMLTP